ncbi:EscU/YscU/HrcU family type III secretion system export apparatus switch protein [Candidatus Desantisbacteria bacterium]|nr:EscU/YscU/HrcU family type III secretion system export apparatus switch protein [Candidatus Desantisbacteria bacterium]
MQSRFIIIAIQFLKIILPFMLVLLFSAFLSNYIQIGFLLSPKCIIPKLSRINPLEGFKKIFSKTAIIEFLKAFFKIMIIGYLSFLVIEEVVNVILTLGDVDIKKIIESIGQIILKIGLKLSVYLMILAIADYGYQRWMHEKNMRMTKQEIKDEMRDIEGNPVIKSRIRSNQRQTAMQRMMSEVPKADVIVTNPTHIAVALKYDSKTMSAPCVVAKGVRLIAERIKKVAKEHDVPVIENKPLARSLYKLCEIGKEIPMQLYRAVAEMLAYIYKLKGKSIN